MTPAAAAASMESTAVTGDKKEIVIAPFFKVDICFGVNGCTDKTTSASGSASPCLIVAPAAAKSAAQDMGDSQEELLEKKQIVEKVIDRLAYHDNVLVPIGKTGLQARGEDPEQGQEDPILIVHPNYVEDE